MSIDDIIDRKRIKLELIKIEGEVDWRVNYCKDNPNIKLDNCIGCENYVFGMCKTPNDGFAKLVRYSGKKEIVAKTIYKL